MKWTQFMDMHSGGGTKEGNYEKIYIEAPKEEAKIIFYNRFGHSPERISCTCCGEDYSVEDHNSLEEATGYHRGCSWSEKTQSHSIEKKSKDSFHDYRTLDEYKKDPSVLIINDSDIKPEERVGDIPEQGYVWKD